MEYTKGEWELRGNKIFIKDTYKSIATVSIQKAWDERSNPIEDVEAKANARLIAAAPELYEHSKNLIDYLRSIPEAAKWLNNRDAELLEETLNKINN